MIDNKKIKYFMEFSLQHRMEKVELFQKVLTCLTVLEEYIPQKIAIDGLRYGDYEEEFYVKDIKERGFDFIRLRRNKKLKYEFTLKAKGGSSQSLSLEWQGVMNQKKWEEYIGLCEILIASFQPDFAYVSRRYVVNPQYSNRIEELLDMINYANYMNSKYEEYGPGGLGLMTYLSEDFTKRLGSQQIVDAPISKYEFCELNQKIHDELQSPLESIMVLTLVDHPYEATEETITSTWEAAMDYFSETNFFAIFMPSHKKVKDGLVGLIGRTAQKSGKQTLFTASNREFCFWHRDQFCYEALVYLDQGAYEKAVTEFTREIENCSPEKQYFKNIAMKNRAKALKMLERWEDEIKDLSELIQNFEPAFEMVDGWCKNCNDSGALEYTNEEHDLIDVCEKVGYWPYKVSNKGYVYITRKWNLEPGNIRNTTFVDLPDSWCCPYCGAIKNTFIIQKVQKKEALEQAEIYQRRGELYQIHGMPDLAKKDFEMARSLDATGRFFEGVSYYE